MLLNVKLIRISIFVLIFLIGISFVYAEAQIVFRPDNQVNPGEVLTVDIRPDTSGVFKYVYIYNSNNILQDTIILDGCGGFICTKNTRVSYTIPANWFGDYYIAVYDYSINDYVIGNFIVGSSEFFDRSLNCDRCGGHKAPPLTNVEMTITASGYNGDTELKDYFEKDWFIVDSNGGVVSNYDAKYDKITWDVNMNGTISKSYIIKSPERTLPATKYNFFTELIGRSQDYFVIVSDPTNVAEELLPIVHVNTRLGGTLPGGQVDLMKFDDNLYLNINKGQKLESELSDPTLTPATITNAYCNLIYFTDPGISAGSTFQVYKKKKGALIDSVTISTSASEGTVSLINLQTKGLIIADIPTLFIIVSNNDKGSADLIHVDKISCVIEYTIASNLGIGVSNELSSGIKWNIQSLPVIDQDALGNNGAGNTLYFVDINSDGTNVDVYLRGNGDLVYGTKNIPLQNEKVRFSTSDSTVSSGTLNPVTLNFINNKIGNNLPGNSRIYLKFYLSVSGSQAAGDYLNLIEFKAVPTGIVP